jgi:hypothetical protein
MRATGKFVYAGFCLALLLVFSLLGSTSAGAQTEPETTSSATGPNGVLVHSKFGGQIFGFDIDQNGTEGVLAEAKTLSGGNVDAAVETFDQKSGKILAVLVRTQTQDDFITLGVVGTSVGLVEHEHVISLLNVQRTFNTINPLSANKITGKWTPPIGTKHLITSVSRTQGSPNAAVFAEDNSGNFIPWVFTSNVSANTFSKVMHITDSANFGSTPPPIAYNTQTNQVILGGGNGCFGCLPIFGVADFNKGTFTEFGGSGFGFVNGIAVDAADNLAVTTTEDDASIEYYDLVTQNALAVVELPNSGGMQFFSGADVEFDPIHKLFLVAQPNSSSAPSGSSIYVYDTNFNLVETLNGFSFSNAFNVVAAHIAIHPNTRTGFIDGPSSGVTEIQGFSY